MVPGRCLFVLTYIEDRIHGNDVELRSYRIAQTRQATDVSLVDSWARSIEHIASATSCVQIVGARAVVRHPLRRHRRTSRQVSTPQETSGAAPGLSTFPGSEGCRGWVSSGFAPNLPGVCCLTNCSSSEQALHAITLGGEGVR